MDSLTKLGFRNQKSKGLDTPAMGGTKARIEVTSKSDSTASLRNKYHNMKVHKPSGGKWTRDGKVMSPQSDGTHNFNAVSKYIKNNSNLNSTVIDTTLDKGYSFK